MKNYQRKSIFSYLHTHCPLANEGRGDFIEVTEWFNGDGFDVEIHNSRSERFQLTYGEFSALKKLVKELSKKPS